MDYREQVISFLLAKLITDTDDFKDQHGNCYFFCEGRIYREFSPVRAEEINYESFLADLHACVLFPTIRLD